MTPVLGIICEKKGIRSVRELSLAEYEEYRQATKRLNNFLKDQELMVTVQRDYDEYKNLLRPYAVEYSKGVTPQLLPMGTLPSEVNKYIKNFLYSIRTFLDHTETNLKRRYGKNSERFNDFKKACSEAYDNNFSYKFIYKLRNYVQHCGMPPSQLNFSKKIIDRQAQKIGTAIQISLDRDELLTKYEWTTTVEAELRQQPEKIDIEHHMSEMLRCLHQINLKLIKRDLQNIVLSAQRVEQLILPLRSLIESDQCTPIIFHQVEKHSTGVDLSFEHIPVEQLKLFNDLHLGN